MPPRADRLTQLSGTERQRCSWGACRESDGRAAAQPPCACTRTQKVAWRRCCRAQLAAARSPWRSPARPGHRSRRPNKQQRKIDSYTALPVASSWPPSRQRHLWSHLSRHRARPPCRHIPRHMIMSQPGAWSAEPSGQLSGPWSNPSLRCHFMLLAQPERSARQWGQEDARRVMPTTSGAAVRWCRWMPHPSAPRQWPQVEPWTIPDDRVVHGSSVFNEGGSTLLFE